MTDTRTALVTGGAGFIGSAMIRRLLRAGYRVVNIDKLSYASSLSTLADVQTSPDYHFDKIDICDGPALAAVLNRHRPHILIHLAAETHVDRSLDSSTPFIESNIIGTWTVLEQVRSYWNGLNGEDLARFRLVVVSTDEVYGDLGETGHFTVDSPYRPRSPYSASKAAADHLARAWHASYGLPVIVTNCSNNYGPYQFPEKLIPLIILRALNGLPLPVYGAGDQVRDWLHVEDHVEALLHVAERGRLGATYLIGGGSECANLTVVETICDLLDQSAPSLAGPRRDLISFVADRPGHDRRYAIDYAGTTAELGWRPTIDFASGLAQTVEWYRTNEWWWRPLIEDRFDMSRQGKGRT